MPQIGWIYQGKKYSHEKMMDFAKRYPPGFKYTPEVLNGMFQRRERNYPSPTGIAGCPREQVLKMQTRYYVDIDKAWAAFRGTTAHEVLEKASKVEPGVIVERAVRALVDMGDGRQIWFPGRVDKVVPQERLLVDYKTVTDFVNPDTQKGRNKMAGWRAQLSQYRWILSQPHEYVTREWWENGVKHEEWTPHEPIQVERAIIYQWHPKEPVPLELDLWSLERAAAHTRARMWRYDGVYDGTKYDVTKGILPAPLDFAVDGDQVWKCAVPGWCPVRELCFKFQKEGL